MPALLDIKNLSVHVGGKGREKPILRGINVTVAPKEIVALVGGSGSGKTSTGLGILRLLAPQLHVTAGGIFFNGRDLLALTEKEIHAIRGAEIGMVFQEPLDAFNPVFSIGYQIEEVLKYHTGLAPAERKKQVHALLKTTGIPDPDRVAHSYPHQLSGGMRQRAMIAQAIATKPKLLIADEPTSNLDVTLQARILALFKRLVGDLDLSIMLITHDLGLVEHLADKVYVMCQGEIVESGKTKDVLGNPQHAYTKELMGALI